MTIVMCRSLNEECQTYFEGYEKPDSNFAMFAVTAVSVGERGRPVTFTSRRVPRFAQR